MCFGCCVTERWQLSTGDDALTIPRYLEKSLDVVDVRMIGRAQMIV